MSSQNVHRIGDANTGGGEIDFTPQTTVYANGKLLSVDGSKGTAHGIFPHCYHCWETAEGSPSVFAEGIRVNGKADTDTCGHPRDAGSPDVFVAT